MPATVQFADRATSWLSQDLGVFVEVMNVLDRDSDLLFDAVIVGSGYGGAMVVKELAGHGVGGKPIRIALLERGSEYLPGAFPNRFSDLAGHMRFATPGTDEPSGIPSGLFDVRLGPDMGVLVACGVGGGSLINAGVMAQPTAAVLDAPQWPAEIRADSALSALFDEVAKALSATPARSIDARTYAMDALGGPQRSAAACVTVAQASDHHRGIAACNGCGDCATGCNVGAKLSVDVTLIAEACAQHPPESISIVSGATVQSFKRESGGYVLCVYHTDPDLRQRQGEPFRIHTKRLILAAGTLGSTELLMRAREDGLELSDHVGSRFSGNGDNLSAIYATDRETKGTAQEYDKLDARHIGPTITRMIDRRSDPDGSYVVQDLAVPAALRRVFEELVTSGSTLASLGRFDWSRNAGPADPAGVDPSRVDRSFVVALIGQDSAAGTLVPPDGYAIKSPGTLTVKWPDLKLDPALTRYKTTLESMARQGHPGATVLANPAWMPLPAAMEDMFGTVRGPTVSVHPLGGCVMADDASLGVVDALGRVFNGQSGTSVHQDLIVLDGSIIPLSLGINPSLTIATIACRAIRELRVAWKLEPIKALPSTGSLPAGPPPPEVTPWPRPYFSRSSSPVPEPPTVLELNERMLGNAVWKQANVPVDCTVEVQLKFKPIESTSLYRAGSTRTLTVDPTRSTLNIYRRPAKLPPRSPISPNATAVSLDPAARQVLLQASLRGELQILKPVRSNPIVRIAKGFFNWFINRGLRDICSTIGVTLSGKPDRVKVGFAKSLVAALRLASHAGGRRELVYDLILEPPTIAPVIPALDWNGKQRLRLVKSIAYERGGNLVNQLNQARLTTPTEVGPLSIMPSFTVDLPYFGSVGVPLLRVTQQANQPRALIDYASTLAYVARALVPIHAWSLRLPDVPTTAKSAVLSDSNARRHRLPADVPGLAKPDAITLTAPDGGSFLLTRYRKPSIGPQQPVLMIHGYSASGTTFAHGLLPEGGLAGHMAARGRDVWVLDLRSSSGMPTAQDNWIFEQMACMDIPLAVQHVTGATGTKQVDIVAHCMGAAMLSLGLFGHWMPKPFFDQCLPARTAMSSRIRRLVLSQVGPAVVMSPANIARAYAFSWLQHYTQLGKFEFRNNSPTTASQMLDRLLAAVPYPREDYFRENPFLTPWRRTDWASVRHRMDALYGVTFKLANMSEAVLDSIDDFFGPLSLATTSQVISFASQNLVTDRTGDGSFISPAGLACLKDVPVLCLHAEENGLADIATREHLLQLLAAGGVTGTSRAFAGMGHQDSLIGVRAPEVYAEVSAFLEAV